MLPLRALGNYLQKPSSDYHTRPSSPNHTARLRAIPATLMRVETIGSGFTLRWPHFRPQSLLALGRWTLPLNHTSISLRKPALRIPARWMGKPLTRFHHMEYKHHSNNPNNSKSRDSHERTNWLRSISNQSKRHSSGKSHSDALTLQLPNSSSKTVVMWRKSLPAAWRAKIPSSSKQLRQKQSSQS